MRWACGQLREDELDVEFLMWDIQRRLQLDQLPDGDTIICFIFDDLERYKNWWFVVRDGEVDLCTENPGLDVDLYISSSIRNLVEVWEGEVPIKTALRKKLLRTQGTGNSPDSVGFALFPSILMSDLKIPGIA